MKISTIATERFAVKKLCIAFAYKNALKRVYTENMLKYFLDQK